MAKRVLLGITSSIAAHKALELIELLRQNNIQVTVILTQHASHMLNINDLTKKGIKIHTQLFPDNFNYQKVLKTKQVTHIQLADNADVFAIIPATANTLAKLAHGIADDLLTTTALAYTKPLLIAPAMNTHMWHHPTAVRNVTQLQQDGNYIIQPIVGELACGYEGEGKIADVTTIYNKIIEQLTISTRLQGKKIIVTSGGTTEHIDDARILTNKSSGKMGAALAQALIHQGAEVILLRAKHAVIPHGAMLQEVFESTQELQTLIEKYSPQADSIFHAAAVSDFTVAKHRGKLSSKTSHTLTLQPTQKIVTLIKKYNPAIKLFAFKAVPGKQHVLSAAKILLENSKADAVIVNDISQTDRGFESDTNEAWIVKQKQKPIHFPLISKTLLAKELIDYLL